MTNDLIPADVMGEISTQVGSDEDFESLGTSSQFLQRLELKSKGKLIDLGKVKPGHYAVIKSSEDADDLGDSIDILVLARKPKAIDMSGDQPIVSYDRNSDLFKDIEKRAPTRDSHCQFGVTFLVVERSTAKCYELFCGSASHRRVHPEIASYMAITAEQIESRGLEDVKPHGPLALTLKSKFKEDTKNGWSWFVIIPKPCSNPFTAKQVPSGETLREEVAKFKKLDENGPEVETSKKKSRAR